MASFFSGNPWTVSDRERVARGWYLIKKAGISHGAEYAGVMRTCDDIRSGAFVPTKDELAEIEKKLAEEE